MEKIDDLPSGQRIWELSSMAVRIEKEAKELCMSDQLWFGLQITDDVHFEMRNMDPAEQRFFAACFKGLYVDPLDWRTEDEIRQELRRELYGNGIGTLLDRSDPVEKTLASLSPEEEEVKYVFIMERDVLPRRKTELSDVQLTSYGEFHAQGEIEYDLIAKVSAAGTTWGLLAQHYDFEDFADRGPRLVEVVHSFDSLEQAKTWMASDRTLVTPEWPDPKEHLEKTVASVISVPGFEDELMNEGSSLASFQRDCAKYGSFMELPDVYKVAILWAEQERKFSGISIVSAGDEVKKTPATELAAAERALDDLIHRRREQLDRASEDSYATRNELWDDIAQFGRFLHSVKSAEPGETLNLTEEIVGYGYDPEAAAADHEYRLEYVSDFNRAKGVYESCIWEISPIIENLKAAGIRVEAGVISMAPPDRDEAMYDVEMER